ncbi:MAG: hypothetical protein L6Q65_05710 [Zoogloea sp.]|nr:hypothetical protein [Zoogloea sp.]
MDQKQELVSGAPGTRGGVEYRSEFADFFQRAARQIDVEESKATAVGEKLLLLFLGEFGGSQPYIPIQASVCVSKMWVECFEKYQKGIYSIERIAQLMEVSQRQVYRVMKTMTEAARKARKPTQQFTGGGRMNPN